MATSHRIAREHAPEEHAAGPEGKDEAAGAAMPSSARRAGGCDGRDGVLVRTFFGPVALGLAVAAFCGAALTWDGGGILFQALDMRAPVVSHQRWINVVMQAPALLMSRFSEDLAAISTIYGVTWGGITLLALIASWYVVREPDPALFVWPALGIGLGLLPGLFYFTTEANVALVSIWPLALATLTGYRRSHIPVVGIFALILAISHPYAIGLFGLLAALAALVRWRSHDAHRQPGRAWIAVWATFAGLTLLRFALFHTSYESEQLSLGTLRWNFTVGVSGLPAIALACTAAAAAALFAAPFVAQRARPGVARALRAIQVCGLLAAALVLVGWARDSHHWWLANKYGYPALFVTLAFIALATLDRVWSPREERSENRSENIGRDWSSRLRAIQAVGLICAIVLATQGATWFALTEQLRRTIDTSIWSCISMAPLGWLRETPLDQFATPSHALLLQGRTPTRAVLRGNGCGEQGFTSGVALNQYYVRPWDQGWFDLRPLRSRIVNEQLMSDNCSFQLTTGWYDTETSDPYWWRWSDGRSARLRILVNGERRVTLNGQIEVSESPDSILVAVNGAQTASVPIAERGLQTLAPLELSLRSGANEIELRSGKPPTVVGGRTLAFEVANLTLTTSGSGQVCRFHP